MEQIPLVVIAGPTGSGKTALSVQLAKIYGGEIVSADSMQIYKQMQIATAKPTQAEMDDVPHHLIGFQDCSESFSVADYLNLARKAVLDIYQRGKLPFLVGGTGLYISSFVDNISFQDIVSDSELRDFLLKRLKTEGGEKLLNELREFDPETAAALHPNNGNRIVRAIEVYRLTGITMSEHQRLSRQKPSPYRLCMIGLSAKNRQILYDRINLRVDLMMKSGLLEEARSVLSHPDMKTAFQAIGYKELKGYFEGVCTLEESVERIKRETRRYAKRQLTWFRRDERIHWLYLDELGGEALIAAARCIIKEKLDI